MDKYYECINKLKLCRHIDENILRFENYIINANNQIKEIILEYKEQKEQKDQLERLAVFSKGTNPVVDNLTNFNKMTQRLEIF